MREISLEDLTKLLEEGFNGEAHFEGHVNVYSKALNEHYLCGTYEASGKFRLIGLSPNTVGRNKDNFTLGLLDTDSKAIFRFRKREGEKVSIHETSPGSSTYYINIPITLGKNINLRITNLTDILY